MSERGNHSVSSDGETPVISYRTVPVAPQPIVIRRDGEDLVVTITPGPPTRLILGQLLLVTLLLPPTCLCGLAAVYGISGGLPDDATATAVFIFAVGLVLLTRSVFRFVPIARFGRVAAILRVSRERIVANVPTLGRRGRREWPASQVADITIRHAGLFPALLRFIRIQVLLTDDRADVILIPSPGGESLALIEDNLRDALGLPVVTA
jgi:hypothetical protein